MSRKRWLIVLSAVAVLSSLAPNADATVWTGTCALSLTFTFNQPVRSASAGVRSPSYSIQANDARDLDPLSAGTQGCTINASPLDPFRATGAGGEGNSVVWTCESAAGTGSWEQSWDPDPASTSGTHAITGTWGNWVMEVNSFALNFAGVINLSLDPSEATKLSACETTGISSIRMVGIMQFQDPAV